ncbi:MAG: 50S ribosomal protein L22 [Patescibacteria group bacterium]
MAKATLNNFRQSPRKIRLLVDLVRGKNALIALTILKTATKRGALPLITLIESALANAKMENLSGDNLVVKEIRVDGGPIMYRQMPRARGSAYRIRKRTSHISVVLGEVTQVKKEKKQVLKKIGKVEKK